MSPLPDTHPGGMPPALKRYWLAGPGLARWATTPTPYRALVAALTKEGVPIFEVHGIAANLYHEHFGKWPGKHEGAPATSAEKLAGKMK